MVNLSKVTIVLVLGMFILGAVLSLSLVDCKKEDETMGVTNGGLVPKGGIPAIDASAPVRTETATLALGCFWGPDSRFGSIDGVVHTRIGYTGGSSNNPTYYNLGGHSETIQIYYDPTKVTYEELLEVFWDSHHPTAQPYSRQYMSIVFYHSGEQRRLAIESKECEESRSGLSVITEIIPFSEFYLAEDYHQKYYLRQEADLLKEFRAIYPKIEDFISSTAVARVNGYVGGYGTLENLEKETNSLGLSEAGSIRLLEIADRGLIPGCVVP